MPHLEPKKGMLTALLPPTPPPAHSLQPYGWVYTWPATQSRCTELRAVDRTHVEVFNFVVKAIGLQ